MPPAGKPSAVQRFRGPLAGSYPAAVALVVCALVPYLMVTAALFPLEKAVASAAGLPKSTFDVVVSLSNAGYAFGTVLAIQLAVRLPARRMLLAYVTLFVVAAGLAMWAPSPQVFAGALIVEGLCTSLMLIAAVPPLVTGFPPEKLPWTGMIMNLCIFGAVAIGPSVGAFAGGQWRPLFAGVTAVGVVALALALLTYEDSPPQDPGAGWDVVAVTLAACGCAAAFFGAGLLETSRSPGALALVPLVLGMAMVVALVTHQFRGSEPLMPMRQLATTIPLSGIVVAMCASAASFGLMELLLTELRKSRPPATTAELFLPEFAAAMVTAGLFGWLFRSRYTPLLALGGVTTLAVAAAVLAGQAHPGNLRSAAVTGLVGLGVGASVSPALFIVGFSLRSDQIQRVFALVELLRGVAAFLVSPVLLYLATSVGGITMSVWICLAIAGVGALAGAVIFLLGQNRLQRPDLDRWQDGEPAWESYHLLARVRK